MKGSVAHINPQRSMAAVLTTTGFSILELIGDDVAIGDQLEWDGHPGGRATVANLTRGRRFDVYFQNHGVHQSQLRQQLLY